MRLAGVDHLGRADGAIRTGRARIGINLIGVRADVRNPVRAEHPRRRPRGHLRTVIVITAGVEINLGFARHDHAVALDAGLDSHPRAVTAHGDHRLADGIANAHRPLSLARKRHDQRLELRIGLTAVSPAEIIDDQAHLGRRHFENLGDVAAHLKRMLRRRPDRDFIIAVMRDDRVRFHRIVVDHGKGKRVFDDLIGLREPLVDVASYNFFMGADVAGFAVMN